MARIALITAQTALVLLVSISAGAHGTERHYGDPFGKRRSSESSPAFSVVVVESSLSSLRRDLERGDGGKVEERTKRMGRAAASLVRATSKGDDARSAFLPFIEALQLRAASLLSAADDENWNAALSDLRSLEASFRAAREQYDTAS